MKIPHWLSRSLLQDLGALLALALVSAGLGAYARSARAKPLPPAPAEAEPAHPPLFLEKFRVYAAQPGGVVLDARDRAAYAEGHVPGALSPPQADFERAYGELRERLESHRNELIVVYCTNLWCGLADDVQKKLVLLGFHHVGRFPDGWEAWKAAGFPEEKSR